MFSFLWSSAGTFCPLSASLARAKSVVEQRRTLHRDDSFSQAALHCEDALLTNPTSIGNSLVENTGLAFGGNTLSKFTCASSAEIKWV